MFELSKHDYSQNTVASISDAIINNKNTVENTVLSIESMPYSWDTGIINNVVTWFEVLQIIDSKEQLLSFFEKTNQRFSSVTSAVCQTDTSVSSKIDSTLKTLIDADNKVHSLLENLDGYSQVPEVYTWMNQQEACIYKIKKYITYDKTTGQYKYDWYSFAYDIQCSNASEDEMYESIISILYTLVDKNGNINTEELESFLEVLASNGYNIASTNKPSESSENYLDSLAVILEEVNSYYINTIKSSDVDEATRNELIAKLSINNIVIATSKTVETSNTSIEYSSYTPKESVHALSMGEEFFGYDGKLYCITKIQPKKVWVKTQETVQELQDRGATYEWRNDGIYELVLPNSKTIYKTNVEIHINSETVAYLDENNEEQVSSVGGKYKITSGDSTSIVYDYSTDKRAIANSFEKEYTDYTNKIINNEIDALKKTEKNLEEIVYDKGKSKVVSKVKKYAIKIVEEFIPGTGVVEEICEDVYKVYSDEKDIEKYNDTIEKIKNDLNERDRVMNRIDKIGDNIAENDDTSVAVIIYFDDATVKVIS